MNPTRLLLYCLYSAILLNACAVKEIPVPAHDAGAVITTSVDMSTTYKWQIYYSLQNNAVVNTVLKSTWDLGFESGDDGYRIILNTSKFMYAYNTHHTDFTAVTDTAGFANGKTWDQPSGNLDSTAVGNWQSTGNVYIIDRGYDENAAALGYRKIIFQSVSSTEYVVRYAKLNGTGEITFHVTKDNNCNFSFLSLTGSGSQVTVEPPKDQWDLCFSQYMHIFYNPTMPYLVTGCLQNRYNTTAVKETDQSFSTLVYSDTYHYAFVPAINTIGYDWKTFSGTTYSTDPTKCYLIKNSLGHFFKLHFIDFYNSSGDKGNPKWEYQAL
ncbi:MAG: hypothetical protein JWO58_138 [Chitinophagaceae bacterium]|nr:hypothetical protein [Chitinophagaceae bacterium]